MAQIETADGVKLNYVDRGEGQPIVLLHGWSQSAALFKHQIAALSRDYRVIAPDMRGHGLSEKPSHGYRVSRLAQDLREFLEALDLQSVTLLGHSMGCAVIWCYWDLFGAERISKLVLVDQPPTIIAQPSWSVAERQTAGVILEGEELYPLLDDLSGPDGEEVTKQMLSGMVTSAMSAEDFRYLVEINLLFPRPHAARLLASVATQDWRDTIARVTVPTLVVSGRASQVPWQSQVWIHEQIAGSRLVTFEESEGGGHFMFFENPAKFSSIVADFMG